jgi:hypothetical protein
VFDKLSECILSIYMENRYTSHDEVGNWTTNELNLKYWEKGGQVQEVNTTQKRTISYWEEKAFRRGSHRSPIALPIS